MQVLRSPCISSAPFPAATLTSAPPAPPFPGPSLRSAQHTPAGMDGPKTPAGVLCQNQVPSAGRPQFPCCAWHNSRCGGHSRTEGRQPLPPWRRCSKGGGTETGEDAGEGRHSSAAWTETGVGGGRWDKDTSALRAEGGRQVTAGGFNSRCKGPVVGELCPVWAGASQTTATALAFSSRVMGSHRGELEEP